MKPALRNLRKPIVAFVVAGLAGQGLSGQLATDSAVPAQAPPPVAKPAPQNTPSQVPTVAPAKPGQAKVKPKSGAPVAKASAPSGGPSDQSAPPPPAWTLFKLNPKTTVYLDFTEANPNSIISFLSRLSGITILKDPAFKTPMTVITAKPVSLKAAFETFNTVLNFSGYELHKKGELMIVEKIPPPPQPRPSPPPAQPDTTPIVKIYKLTNASAQQVARTVNDVFSASAGGGQGGGQPQQFQFGSPFGGPNGLPQMGSGNPGGGASQFKVSSDEYSNSVIVFASPQLQPQIADLIKEIDKPVDSAYDSEIFPLHHVDVDEVLDAVREILNSQTPSGRGGHQDQQQQQQNYYYNPFGGNSNSTAKGSQTAVAIKPTNSIIVTATKANLSAVRKLISNLDQVSDYVGSTFVITLKNAKAADVATMLNEVFTKKQQPNNGPFFISFQDFGQDNSKKNSGVLQDVDDGKVVNVRDLTGKVNVIAEPSTNSLVIVTQPSNMKFIKAIIDQIDHVAQQVMIETIIVEANLDKTTKLGAEWSFLQNKVLGNPNVTSSGAVNYGLRTGGGTLPGFSYTLSGVAYQAFLNALQTDTRFKVLDTPRIFTSNNVKAEINVSTKVPYLQSQQVSSATGTFNSYQYLDVGVVLDVTPRVTSSGQVTMDVTQTASDLAGFSAFNAPIVNNRSAYTTVSVKDGETIVLGGIIRHNTTTTVNKIPILGDLPLIGNLFKSSSVDKGQTELMVFLTPHIVRDAADAQKIKGEQSKELTQQTLQDLKAIKP